MPKKYKKFLMPAGAASEGCPCYFALICITAPGDACLWELFHPRQAFFSLLTSHHSPLITLMHTAKFIPLSIDRHHTKTQVNNFTALSVVGVL